MRCEVSGVSDKVWVGAGKTSVPGQLRYIAREVKDERLREHRGNTWDDWLSTSFCDMILSKLERAHRAKTEEQRREHHRDAYNYCKGLRDRLLEQQVAGGDEHPGNRSNTVITEKWGTVRLHAYCGKCGAHLCKTVERREPTAWGWYAFTVGPCPKCGAEQGEESEPPKEQP